MKNKKSDKELSQKAKDAVDAYVSPESFKTDPNGSWTGRPEDKTEKPIQDADDL